MILCGGTYNTPQLLMLSGVGPATELERHGITPVLDLPGVGGNLSEHPHVPMEFAVRHPVTFLNELRFDRLATSVVQWAMFGTGALANQINSCNVVIRTQPHLEQPDIQLMCNPVRMDAKLWFPGGLDAAAGSRHGGRRGPASEEPRSGVARLGQYQ